MNLLAGLIVFSALGAWLSARQRAASAALTFGVIGAVLFCPTPLGAGPPALINGIVTGTAGVGAELVDGQPQDAAAKDDADEGDDAKREPAKSAGGAR
jgi:hypothetical protein